MNIFSMTQSAALAGKIFDSKHSTESQISYNSYKPAFVFGRHSSLLERTSPEAVGIPSSHIQNFIKRIVSDKSLNMHDILIVRDGKLICEVSFGAERTNIWKHTFSACKSITSLAIGMLIDDGVLTLDETLISIFSSDVGTISKIRLKDLTVENLLTMRSSVLFAEVDSAMDNNWKRDFLNSSTEGEIGKTFRYNSLNTYMLAAIVKEKTGKSLTEFLNERLFSPLEIVDYHWETSPEDIEKGGWGLYIYPEDLAKIGMMVMDHGVYNGKRVISEAYIEKATSIQVKVKEDECLFHYGYQFWVGNDTDSFLFNGMLGQNVFGFRRNGVVIVTHAGNGEFFQSSSYFKYAQEFFDRDFERSILQDRRAERALKKYVSGLSSYRNRSLFEKLFDFDSKRSKIMFSEHLGEYIVQKGDTASVGLMPLILQMVQSEYTKGFEKIVLDYEAATPYLRFFEKDSEYTFALGFNRPILGNYTFGNNTFWIANSAFLKYNEEDLPVLTVRFDFLETPSSRVLKMVFNDERVLLKLTEIPGEEFASDLTDSMLKKVIEKPIVSAFFEKIGDDYIDLKLRKAFSPEITLRKTKK